VAIIKACKCLRDGGGSQQTFRTRDKLTGRRPPNRQLYYSAVNNATVLKHNPKPDQLIILGYVIPIVYAKLISRKGAVYNTTKYI